MAPNNVQTPTHVKTQQLLAELRAARETYRRTMARSAELMAARYATGEYPVREDREAWLKDLVASLMREGIIAPDHTGKLQITIDLHGGGIRHHAVDDIFRLVAA